MTTTHGDCCLGLLFSSNIVVEISENNFSLLNEVNHEKQQIEIRSSLLGRKT